VQDKVFGKVQVFTMLESRAEMEIFIPKPFKVANRKDVRQCTG